MVLSPKNSVGKAPLDFLVFSPDCDILWLSRRGMPMLVPKTADLITQLKDSMRSGDLLELYLFCSDKQSEKPYRLLRLTKFYEYGFIFLEKTSDEAMGAVGFLGVDVTDFIPLMSPDTDLYKSVIGRIMYEFSVMLDKSAKNTAGLRAKSDFTPEALLIKSLTPILYDEMILHRLSVRNCDLVRFVNIIKLCLGSCSMFGGVRLDTKEIGFNHENDIYPIYPAALVYLFTSIMHLMSYISLGQSVEVSMFCHDEGVIMEFMCEIDPCLSLSRDAGTFSELGRLFPDLVFSASVAEILGNGLGFYPTVRRDSDILDIRMKITGSRETAAEFRYSNPYPAIAALVAEAESFLDGQLPRE